MDRASDERIAPVRLTRTVSKGGCAAKLPAGELSALLRSLPRQEHPDLLVGTDWLDDAAAWRVSDELAMVQTLDFFTPVLDDPADFGAVAAANALSDVYAMGAEPATALTVLAWPSATLDGETLRAMMAGAVETINAAGARLVGGHSIDDDTLKLGFSVTGFAHPERLWANRSAREGDLLILTKPLGTGTLTGALKSGELPYEALADAVRSMRALNRVRLPAGLRAAIRAATDVTGFGLLGHALHVAEGSRLTVALDAARVPLLEHARSALERGIVTRAHGTNRRYVEGRVTGLDALDEATRLALVDPQTSGGLLLAVDPARADDVLAALREDAPRAEIVGEALAREEAPLRVR